jgi:hypothetical protein
VRRPRASVWRPSGGGSCATIPVMEKTTHELVLESFETNQSTLLATMRKVAVALRAQSDDYTGGDTRVRALFERLASNAEQNLDTATEQRDEMRLLIKDKLGLE